MQETRYMISDASKMIDVKSHVLRYWEGELDLEISRNEMGNRYYRQEDIELLKSVKTLRDKGFKLKAIKLLIPKMHKVNELDAKRLFDLRDKLNIALGLVDVKEQDTGAKKRSDEQKPDKTRNLYEASPGGDLNNESQPLQVKSDVAAAREKEDIENSPDLNLEKEIKMQGTLQKDAKNKELDSLTGIKEKEGKERESARMLGRQETQPDEKANSVHQIDENGQEIQQDIPKAGRKSESRAESDLIEKSNKEMKPEKENGKRKEERPEGRESVGKQRKEGDLKHSEEKKSGKEMILDAKEEQENPEAFLQTEDIDNQEIVAESGETGLAAVKDGHELMAEGQNEDKLIKFHQIMKEIVADAMKENGEQVAAKMTVQMTDVITETMIKELDYHMRVREEREEERFKQLDRTIREFQQQRQQVAATKDTKKKESKFFKKNKKRI